MDPNEVILVDVLAACARARDLDMAKRVQGYIDEYGFRNHLKLNTALLDVYCKSGCVRLLEICLTRCRRRTCYVDEYWFREPFGCSRAW